ncbi:hypothetical protein IJ118_03595 [Candidatus Saccharibacteria bacterium]|nr:hypothetical protein [Candidatus Saccharibacteria bacterium]
MTQATVYAEPVEGVTIDEAAETGANETQESETAENDAGQAASTEGETPAAEGKSCKESLGALGWLVCPATGKISEAVDWIYDKIEELLVINPVRMQDGQPIYEIWKYMRGITNVLFIIFMLVMIYSQLTGVGITNYGLKKVLPKLILGAVLVNLSFVICSLAVDLSNIIGDGLRGLFETIETNTLATTTATAHVSMAEMYSALAGGGTLAVGAGVVAFETGAIWMLIPTVLSAIAAVVVGLITIALRQAVVVILIMIAPLAIMAYILPNTDRWFRQWKDLLFKMLVFYPMFSLLFGASSLAGWAIIVSAQNGFWVIIGVAVQIFPLIFSWSLMKMSGTFLSSINAKLSAIAARPVATNRGWAESHRELTRQKYLAARNVYTPSNRLMQFMSDRKIAREEETKEHADTVKLRGQAYAARTNYGKNGVPNRTGEEAYEAQARRAQYQRTILNHQNNMSKGLGDLEVVKARATMAQKARIGELDVQNIKAFDALKMEQARGEKIDYNNAVGFHKRMEDAINAHFDLEHAGESTYRQHDMADRMAALERYNTASDIMEGKLQDTQYAAAFAAHAYDTQAKTVAGKYQKYFELTPPTRDVEYRLGELTTRKDAADLIDAIIPGMRVLNMRGDTDLLRKQMQNMLKNEANGGESVIQLGSHASQALAGFLMFEVKDSDPWLRRFGKYINLETAKIYNKNERVKPNVDYEEYIKGYYYAPDDVEHKTKIYSKRGMKELMEGTSLDGIERTAIDNYIDSVMEAYSDENGVIEDYDGFEKKFDEVNKATAPQLISAMRKVLSGSEALNSFVKDVTGYYKKQNKTDGTYSLHSIFDDDDIKKRFGDNIDNYKQYRKKWAKKYLSSLLPSQVLSMRTDELQAYEQLLPQWFMEENPELHDKLVEGLLANYGDLSDAERAKLLTAIESREEFRECIGMGVLEQISRTNARRGVLDSKPLVRAFLGLDGDSGAGNAGLSKYLTDKKKMNGEKSKDHPVDMEDKEVERIMREVEEIYKQRENASSNSDKNPPVERVGMYSSADIRAVTERITEIYRHLEKDNDVIAFYDETTDLLKDNVPIVIDAYSDYHDKHPEASITDLANELYRLLGNLVGDE